MAFFMSWVLISKRHVTRSLSIANGVLVTEFIGWMDWWRMVEDGGCCDGFDIDSAKSLALPGLGRAGPGWCQGWCGLVRARASARSSGPRIVPETSF